MDIQIDNITNDLIIEDGDFQKTEVGSPEEVSQRVQLRLLTRRGEWFMDTSAGLPYLQELLVKGSNLSLVDDFIQATILNTDDVSNIIRYEGSLDKATRAYKVIVAGTTSRNEIFTIGVNL